MFQADPTFYSHAKYLLVPPPFAFVLQWKEEVDTKNIKPPLMNSDPQWLRNEKVSCCPFFSYLCYYKLYF